MPNKDSGDIIHDALFASSVFKEGGEETFNQYYIPHTLNYRDDAIRRITQNYPRRTQLKFNEKEVIENLNELWLLASQLAEKSNIPLYKIENIEIRDTVRIISQYLQEHGVEFNE